MSISYGKIFSQEPEIPYIHVLDIPTVGEEIYQDESDKIQFIEKEPKLKFFPKLGWLKIPVYDEVVEGESPKKRKREETSINYKNPYKKEYITEYFTQEIILRALRIIKRTSVNKLGVKASILYTSSYGEDAGSLFFQTPDQGSEKSAHLRINVENKLGVKLFYEICYRHGVVAIMPFIVKEFPKRVNTWTVAWYLMDANLNEGQHLGWAEALLDENDHPGAGIESLQRFEKHVIGRMAKLLYEQFSLIQDIDQDTIELMVNEIKGSIVSQNAEYEDNGQAIMDGRKKSRFIMVSRWDDLNVEGNEFYVAYPFNTKPLSNSKLLNIIKR